MWSKMRGNRQTRCSKACWELMELVERQAETIKKLTLKIKELEALLEIKQ